jgi:hypothetical protein
MNLFEFLGEAGQGFIDLGKDLLGAVGQIVDLVVDPIANALGVHPDVVKIAAAALGMYYSEGIGFVDEVTGVAVSEAAVADIVGSSGVEALAVANNLDDAISLAEAVNPSRVPMLSYKRAYLLDNPGVTYADLARPPAYWPTAAEKAEALAAASGAVATPVATAPLATMGAATPLTAAELAAADASAGLLGSSNALAPAAAGTNALTAAELAALDAGLGGVTATLPAAATSTLSAAELAALDAGLGGVSTGSNALAAGAFDAASALETQLGAGAGAGSLMGPPAAGDVGAGTISGYGGAGDVLDPVTGAVISGADAAAITNAGFNLSDFAKFAKDYGVPISALISGITGSQAATNAAEIQAQSAREARALAEKMFNEQKALQEPYRAAGITAQNQLLNLLGLSGNTTAAEYGKYARPFGMADFQADPGYAFRLSEGMKALEASRAARGGLLSGATGRALQRYGQEMGAQEYTNAFNRYQTERANRLNPLAGLTASGQAAAAGQAANAGNYATTAGNLITDIGAAQAAGSIGSANAITNALNQFARYSASQNLANQIRSSVYAPAIP